MGELLLCHETIAALPYYIEETGINIYSMEELSYYISGNVYLLDHSFMCESLCTWVEKQMQRVELAQKLRENIRTEGKLSDFVFAILQDTAYCTMKEMQEIVFAVRQMEQKSDFECDKIRADQLMEKEKYLAAIYRYKHLLDEADTKETGEVLRGNIWHNLGTAYARLFLFEEAGRCFEKAYALNKQKESIPVRIDELTNTLITEHNIDYEKIEKEKEELNSQLKNTELEMTDVQARAKENMKIADQLTAAKKELSNFKVKKETEYSQKYSSELINLQNEKRILESKIRNKQDEDSERLLKIKQDQNRKQELYKKWDEVSNKTLTFDPDSFICPTCKREYETEKIEEMQKQFENNFALHIKSEQDAINKEGQAINIRLDENTKAREILQQEIQEFNSKLTEISNKITEIEKAKENDNSFDVTSLPEYNNKIKEIEELEEKVNNLTNGDISYLQNKKEEITEEINKLNKILNERDIQEKTKLRIEELQNEEEEISMKIQELEGEQYALEEFTKNKVELLENAINSKFEIVKFRLFDTQINGGLIECCDTLVNGVPYSDVNNAHKILAGLDIINTLIKFYNTSAPIFIDNRESINEIYPINTQIISLIVTTDSQLRIEVM